MSGRPSKRFSGERDIELKVEISLIFITLNSTATSSVCGGDSLRLYRYGLLTSNRPTGSFVNTHREHGAKASPTRIPFLGLAWDCAGQQEGEDEEGCDEGHGSVSVVTHQIDGLDLTITSGWPAAGPSAREFLKLETFAARRSRRMARTTGRPSRQPHRAPARTIAMSQDPSRKPREDLFLLAIHVSRGHSTRENLRTS